MIPRIGLSLALFLLLFGCQQNSFDPLSELSKYDEVWDSPSPDYNGSMPLGNGETGLNVWMEPNGDLLFYISRTDAWDDNARLVKVGKVRVTLSPNPLTENSFFQQRLHLADGQIAFLLGKKEDPVRLHIRVDANDPMVYVTCDASQPTQLTARIELWRTEPYELPTFEVSDVLLDRSKSDSKHGPMIVEPDLVLTGQTGRIGWYHHNIKSIGPDITMDVQGLSGFPMEDPILHRTFGALISGTDATNPDDLTLITGGGNSQTLSICVVAQHPSTPGQWLKWAETQMVEVEKSPFAERFERHKEWWNQFWNRSWIFASDESGEAFDVTKAYTLQRFINAGNGRGAYPIKFNGSIFTVPSPEGPGDADYRRWGPGYWWQNTRLPYLGMCTSGDFDLLKPFFDMYAGEVFELSKYRTQAYFGHGGVYYPECIYFWGAVFSESYGWQPASEREDKLQVSGWHKWEWVAGPELVWMMLDYYDHTLKQPFLTDTILPLAMEVMTFFDEYYKTDEKGKLVMFPSQALETWWDCTNPMPEVAGLTAIAERILALKEGLIVEDQRTWIRDFYKKIPDLPLRETEDGLALAPAERFENKPNIENPELYAVFPFRLVTMESPDLQFAINAFNHRWDKGNFGWRQEEIFMTYLGLTDLARENLVGRARNHDPNSRFPAFWGPNYDWVPDQDHGGILMKAFQSMLIQTDGEEVHLLPAWPETWDVNFKVRVPGNKTITGSVREGELKMRQGK